ncbi:adenosine kinase [Agrobacterium rubi]|nr:adenosine kinase [Agrobacterium rubi]NTF23942.1 adenosine kinase [Agrobacterium rubi]
MTKEYDILSIGNAIVDILSHVDEEFLDQHSLQKGSMLLVDETTSRALLATLSDTLQASGGSAANTAACIASLGASSAYIGKVAEDALGQAFREDMGRAGVAFSGGELYDAIPTANCLAVVTPDGERTMSTFLGACRELSKTDISADLVKASRAVFLEGYLLDSEPSARALFEAARLACANGCEVAVTLSDANCVRRNLHAFKTLIMSGFVDIVIANEKEIAAFFEDEHPDITVHEAIELCRNLPFTTVVTMGPLGAAAITDGKVERASAFAVDAVIDLVGAGDSFAAGYLVGHVRGLPPLESLTLGAACAAEIITTNGARPTRSLADLPAVSAILSTDAAAAI